MNSKRDHSGSDPCTNTYRAVHTWDSAESLTTTLVFTIAAITGRRPEDIRPLEETLDTEALEDLFRPLLKKNSRTTGRITFFLDGHLITVYATGEILIDVSKQQS